MSIAVRTVTPNFASAYRPQAMSTPTPTSVTASSVDYGQGVPVTNSLAGTSEIGGIAGAIGGGFIGFKWLAPFLGTLVKSGSLPGLAIAGVVGLAAMVGGWLGFKFTGG